VTTRRAFLQASASVAIASAFPSAVAQEKRDRRLLILVELKGGNDGLNTVVPYADPEYARLRPRLAVSREHVVALTEKSGLHPSLEKLLPTWRDEKLAIVQGVGYPQPNLSHFRSIEIWDTASKSDEYLEEGWLARAFAQSPSPEEFLSDGVAVGTADLGPLAGARAHAIALTDPDRFLRNAKLARPEGEGRNAALRHILKVENDVQQSARRLAPGREFRTEFPNGPFGLAVKTASQLAANPAGVAVIRLSLAGFDTHANQANLHGNLLRQACEGLVALRSALEEVRRWDSTLVATYSEFGRRARENQSNGTDHGTASVHFVMGGRVQGGLYGSAPELGRLDGNGNPPFAVDFRSYYATFLDRWWGIDSRRVFAGTFKPLDFLS
jgi:uncharacterized protein (DUF1501 family)